MNKKQLPPQFLAMQKNRKAGKPVMKAKPTMAKPMGGDPTGDFVQNLKNNQNSRIHR